MEFKLTKEQKQLRKDIINFAQKQLHDESFAERDEKHQFSSALWTKAGERCLQGLNVPVAYGGKGYDAIQLALALEGLGYGTEDQGLLLALGAHLFGVATPLVHFGTEAQKRKYLPNLANGSWMAARALTEPGGGSDLDGLTTTAQADGDGFLLSGEKAMVLNAPEANVFLVYAVTDTEKGFDGGVTCFLVEKGTAGLEVNASGSTVGYRTAPMGTVSLKEVKVSADAVLGGIGQAATVYARAAEWERALIASVDVGRMEKQLEESIKYARSRKAGGQPIGKHQAVSHKITDMKIRYEVARLLSYKAAWQLEQGAPAGMDAAISKLFASESMMQSALDATQIFGGQGFLEENGVGRSLRDALGGTLYAGTSAIQRNTIAQALGIK